MKKTENKDQFKIVEFIIYLLDYGYKELSSIPKDIFTEIHLRFFKKNTSPDKKILCCWDFNQRLSKAGDFMLIMEYFNILRHEFGLNLKKRNIDICFIDDKNHYNAKQLRFSKTYLFKKNIQTLVVTNPYIDSVFSFKSNREFEIF